MGVVPSAIAQPRAPHAQIERDHLNAMIDVVEASRVTTVYAPAGYGKTMAVLHWAGALEARGRSVLWLAARAGISTLEDFVTAVAAAAEEAGFDWHGTSQGAPPHTTLARLAATAPNRPVLVLDDAQILNAEIMDLVTRIVAGARDSLTTIIVSRSLRTIPIARLRALGYLVEVGVRDLRFSLAETLELITRRTRTRVDPSVIEQLVKDTEGWPAGIAMARTIQQKDWQESGSALCRPSGLRREFEAYFNEEVVSPEPIDIRNFLVATAVLDELTPAACAAATGLEDSRAMLEHVEEAGLFLEARDVDRSSYRYHPLFREVVLRRLNDRDPARASDLQKRVSRHFAATGQPELALGHAKRSGDRIFLADQLELLAEPLTYQGKLYMVAETAVGLSGAILATRPRLALALAWRRIRSLAFESAEAMIDLAAAEHAARREREGSDTPELRHLAMMIEHRRIMCAAARDDMPEVERNAAVLLRQFGDDEPYLSCTLLAQLMTARRELYHFHDMLKLEAEVRRAIVRPGTDFAAISLKASIAPTLAAQGKVSTAEQLLREALSFAQSFVVGQGKGIAALPALPLAELLYDCGKLDEARALVETYLEPAREWGFVDQLASGHIVRARLIFNDGDLVAAMKALDETQLLAIECGLDRLRAYAVGEQVRMLIRSGEGKHAQSVLEASGLAPNAEPYPTLSPTRQNECIAVAWLRIEMQGHRLAQARKVAKRWSELVRRNGAIRSAVVFELLLAEIAILAGDRSEARRAVREAVTLAAPTGWTRMFLDEGDAIGSLLAEAYGQGPALDSVPDQFGERLVAAFAGTPPAVEEDEYGLSSRLANREIEILRMVSGGLRNREIGNRLGLTEGTVKWYMQQIYDKLGVRRRPQAVTRARQLGVLA
jgi:LuxR family maltose regulon positive regulatory protein